MNGRKKERKRERNREDLVDIFQRSDSLTRRNLSARLYEMFATESKTFLKCV